MDDFLAWLAPVWRPHPGQLRFLQAEEPTKVLACGRRWGKTDVAAVQTLFGLRQTNPTRHIIIAPTRDQARLVFDRVEHFLELLGVEARAYRTPYPALEVGDHRLTARSGSIPRNLRGHEATDLIIDEAAFLPESVITEVAMPMLATTGGRLTLISTPQGKNHFWRFFCLGQSRGDVWSHQAPTRENPHVLPAFLEAQRGLISDRAFRVEYEAEFIDGAGRVFSTEAITSSVVAQPRAEPDAAVAIGIDWARYRDFTAIVVVAGSRDRAAVLAVEQFQGLSWPAMLDRVAQRLAAYPYARVTCDTTGVGDAVTDFLRERCPAAALTGLTFTPKIKHELIGDLAWMMERSSLSMPPEPELIRQLEHFESTVRDSGHTRLGAVSGFHDDLVVALALAVRGLPTLYRPAVSLGEPRTFSTNPSP